MRLRFYYISVFLTALFFHCLAYAGPGLKAVGDNIRSPIETNARWVLIYGSAYTLAVYLVDHQRREPGETEIVKHKWNDPGSNFGDLAGQIIPNAGYALGSTIYSYLSGESSGYANASLMVQATTYASVLTTALKYTIREQRPDSSRRNSFPSGHATTAFAFASFVGCTHPWPFGLAAYSLAAFVAYSRVNDNVHDIEDVSAGATIGTAYGVGVCLAERIRNKRETAANYSWYLAPRPDGFSSGVTFGY